MKTLFLLILLPLTAPAAFIPTFVRGQYTPPPRTAAIASPVPAPTPALVLDAAQLRRMADGNRLLAAIWQFYDEHQAAIYTGRAQMLEDLASMLDQGTATFAPTHP